MARSHGARFLLRIEDLDPQRSRPEFEQSQLADLRALGLDWDEPPVRQSQRTSALRRRARQAARVGTAVPVLLHARRDPRGGLGASRRAARGRLSGYVPRDRGRGAAAADRVRRAVRPARARRRRADRVRGSAARRPERGGRRLRRRPRRRRPRLSARSRRRRRGAGHRRGRARRRPRRLDAAPDPVAATAGACRRRAMPTSRSCSARGRAPCQARPRLDARRSRRARARRRWRYSLTASVSPAGETEWTRPPS